MKDHQADVTLRILRAALRLASQRIRRLPRLEPEVGLSPLDDAVFVEGVPDDFAPEVDRLANFIVAFGESTRAAERKGFEILAYEGETIPKKRRQPDSQGR